MTNRQLLDVIGCVMSISGAAFFFAGWILCAIAKDGKLL
jgi:hypothetical protein